MAVQVVQLAEPRDRPRRGADDTLVPAVLLGSPPFAGHQRGQGRRSVIGHLAAVRVYDADLDGAVEPLEAALAHFRSEGDRWWTATALQFLSYVKEPAQALELLGEAHRLFMAERDLLRVANCAFMMAATLVRELGDPDRAAPLAAEALRLSVRLGSEHEQAHARSVLAEACLARGEDARAAEFGRDCLEAFRRVGDHRCEALMLLLLGRAAERIGTRGDALAYLRGALGVAVLATHAHTIPVALDRLAGLLADHDPPVAIVLHAAADARHFARQPVHAQGPGRVDRLDAMRRAAGPDVFAAARQRGLHAPLEEIVDMIDAALQRADNRERLR